CARSDSNLDSW
nr:immunoglobulin heavy chain junction region [Macaca mulatta]